MPAGLPSIIKIALFVFNALLFAFGATSLLLGVGLKIKKSEAVGMINTLDNTVSGVSRKTEVDAAAGHGSLVFSAAAVFCVIGGFVLLLSLVGFYSVSSGKSGCLYAYTMLLGLLLALQLALVAGFKFMFSTIATKAQHKLFELQNKYYIPLSSYMNNRTFSSEKVAISHLINTIQIQFECCGAKKVGDIARSKSWSKAKDRTWNSQLLFRPITCCKLLSSKEKAKVVKPGFNFTQLKEHLLDPDCPFTEMVNKQTVHNKTCTKELLNYVSSYSSFAMIVCAGLACAEALGIVGACCLISSDDDDDDDYDDDE